MVFKPLMWLLFVINLLMCCEGFIKFVYFLSVGYGLSVLGEGIAIASIAISDGTWSIALLIQCILCVVYGFRLSGFLIIREMKSASYRKTLDSQTNKPMPLFVKICIWLFTAVLYVLQVSPIFYRANTVPAGRAGDACAWVGAAVMLTGIILEATADKQKSASKKARPDMVAKDGLFRLCRCPNYFGEIIFWTGVFISGFTVLTGWQWVVAAIGYVCIVYIMFNGAQRLEKRQNKNYGDKQEYWDYANKTPIIIPFIPLYHLVKEEKK